jgi:O-acetyl-ADP-ribose deacetylase (regulator of RNase III)
MVNEVGRKEVGGALIVVGEGDLTAQDTDAIVNAANEQLAHGGGVAAAIVRAGGKDIREESDRWVAEHGPVSTGTAAITTGGTLPARWVVHAVGPRYREGQDNEGLLRQAVSAALDTAAAHGARSVAFPAISAGVFGYPRPEATAAIAGQVAEWLGAHPGELDEVRLVGYDRATAEEFAAGLIL